MNPSLGLLISEQFVHETEFLVLAADDFAAERLGVAKGGPNTATGPIDQVRFAQLIDGESLAVDGITLGMDAPIDRRSVCFTIQGRRADRLRHIAIRHWLGPKDLNVAELVRVAKALCAGHDVKCIYVPPKSPALAWREDFVAAGVELVEIKSAEFLEAQQALEQAVTDGSLRHRGQLEMTAAVGGLAARTAGDSSPWSRRSSSVNVAPMFAAAAAWAGAADAPAEFFVLRGGRT